jgi:hypothetical protein
MTSATQSAQQKSIGQITSSSRKTPSVTPDNQSLLVKLSQSGAILLSGDVVHFQYGWDHKIVPGNVWNKEKTSASFQRLTDVVAENNAKLWIEHDKDQGNARRLARIITSEYVGPQQEPETIRNPEQCAPDVAPTTRSRDLRNVVPRL